MTWEFCVGWCDRGRKGGGGRFKMNELKTIEELVISL